MPFLPGVLSQQDVVVGGTTYPSVVQIIKSSAWSGSPTTHNIVLGAASSISAGDLLIACISMDGTATTSCTGWTVLNKVNNNSGSGTTLAKVAVGTEGGSTVNFVTSAGESGGGQIYHIQDWGGTLATHVDEAMAAVTRVGTGMEAPTLTPSFGTAYALWIVSGAMSSTVNPTGVPAGWTYSAANGTTTATGGTIATGYLQQNVASDTPGIITCASTSDTMTCCTIAVKGP